MNTTELIKLLKSVEFGASGRPREISFSSDIAYYPRPDIKISGTGDGVAGAELDLTLSGEVWLEEAEETEQEPKYYVVIKGRSSYRGDNALFLYKEDGVVYAGDNIKAFNAKKGNEEFQFTEQEIKDYDERYFAFAIPVEELEE